MLQKSSPRRSLGCHSEQSSLTLTGIAQGVTWVKTANTAFPDHFRLTLIIYAGVRVYDRIACSTRRETHGSDPGIRYCLTCRWYMHTSAVCSKSKHLVDGDARSLQKPSLHDPGLAASQPETATPQRLARAQLRSRMCCHDLCSLRTVVHQENRHQSVHKATLHPYAAVVIRGGDRVVRGLADGRSPPAVDSAMWTRVGL
jgi:hypothetical protein